MKMASHPPEILCEYKLQSGTTLNIDICPQYFLYFPFLEGLRFYRCAFNQFNAWQNYANAVRLLSVAMHQ